MWTTIRLNLMPHGAILRLEVQLQLTPPNGHKAGHKLPEVFLIVLGEKEKSERDRCKDSVRASLGLYNHYTVYST